MVEKEVTDPLKSEHHSLGDGLSCVTNKIVTRVILGADMPAGNSRGQIQFAMHDGNCS